MSFSKAFARGSAVAGSWIDDYKQNKIDDIENMAYEKKFELEQEELQNMEEGAGLQSEMDGFTSMDGNALSNTILQGIIDEGGKIDDQTYKVMNRIGQEWDAQKHKRLNYEQKNQLFKEKKDAWQRYASTVGDAVKTREKKEEKWVDGENVGGNSLFSEDKKWGVRPEVKKYIDENKIVVDNKFRAEKATDSYNTSKTYDSYRKTDKGKKVKSQPKKEEPKAKKQKHESNNKYFN